MSGGLIYDLDFDAYLAADAYSTSFLKQVLRSPKYAKWMKDHPNEFKRTKSMEFGTLVHTFLLEPERFDDEVAVCDENDRRKKAYKDFAKEHEGKTIITLEDMRTLHDIRHSVNNNEYAKDLLRYGHAEVSMAWSDPDSGLNMKGRIDFLRDEHIIVDVKTCQMADPSLWDFQARHKLFYNMQAALYTQGYSLITGEVPKFFFICIENSAPYDVVVREVDNYFLDEGRIYAKKAMELLTESLDTGVWKGIADDKVIPLTASEFFFNQKLLKEKEKKNA